MRALNPKSRPLKCASCWPNTERPARKEKPCWKAPARNCAKCYPFNRKLSPSRSGCSRSFPFFALFLTGLNCYPLTFTPILKERVWGGRRLERYGKALHPTVPIGESWEISDRPEGTSVIQNGPLAGKDLRWLMEHHSHELLGAARPASGGRFPLLLK